MKLGVLALSVLLGACAATPPSSRSDGAPDPGRRDLACLLPSNCVSSQSSSDLVPLRYTGTPAQAMSLLQSTLATFSEAKVTSVEALALESIFTTPIGFRDRVEFRIDATAQRIDFRSRSLFGLFDFGKNRSRMQEFVTRFEQQSRR